VPEGGGVVVVVVVVGGVVVVGEVVVGVVELGEQLSVSDVRSWLVTLRLSPAQVTLAVSPAPRLRLWVTAAAMP
jgi:hypothetical protein